MSRAADEISGRGANKLKDFPDTYLDDMEIAGHINSGECAGTQGFRSNTAISDQRVSQSVSLNLKNLLIGNASR